jgi:hypothetical protein
MGEPMANMDAVLESIFVLSDPGAGAISMDAMTLSTVGSNPNGIRRLGREAPKVRLALSIGAVRPEVRKRIMPVEYIHPLRTTIMDAAVDHARMTGMYVSCTYCTHVAKILLQKTYCKTLPGTLWKAALLNPKQTPKPLALNPLHTITHYYTPRSSVDLGFRSPIKLRPLQLLYTTTSKKMKQHPHHANEHNRPPTYQTANPKGLQSTTLALTIAAIFRLFASQA